MKELLRGLIKAVAPSFALNAYRRYRLIDQASRLALMARGEQDPNDYFDCLGRFPDFIPFQKRLEIVQLLRIVSAAAPRAVCEIGTAAGGTTFLLAKAAAPDAVIISIDNAIDGARQAALRRFASQRQRIICFRSDSHQPGTQEMVTAILGRQTLDVLFIDGDHTKEGVAADFRSFGPLVREGGFIAFHDIVPDFLARFGRKTASFSGGVPGFWRELRQGSLLTQEIIEDPDQDGYGIGLVHCNRDYFNRQALNTIAASGLA
ncbi:MAG: class I SAM-dependent methyltransferase [Limisphaerales bacterium]